MKVKFEDWSQNAQTGVCSAYVVDPSTDRAIDTIYQNPKTGEVWTHSGKNPEEYEKIDKSDESDDDFLIPQMCL